MPASTPPAAKRGTSRQARRPRGRPKLEDLASLETRLLDVALDEFIRHGYGAASLTRMATMARVSKATFYSRYASKEQLFRALMQEQIKRIDPAEVLKGRAERRSLEEGLKAFGNRMLELSLQGGLLEVNRLISSESHRFPEMAAAASERTRAGIQRISSFIEECAEHDDIPCRDPVMVAEAFIYMLRGWYANATLAGDAITPVARRKWVDQSVRLLIAGRRTW